MGQFFATGDAARNLATSPDIRGLFKTVARSSVKAAAAADVNRDDLSDCISNWARASGNRENAKQILEANDLNLFNLANVRPPEDRRAFIELNNIDCS